MKQEVGETAGKIFDVLTQNVEISVSRIPKAINEKTAVAYQALGWLAREDKITYTSKGKGTYVKLS
ncbi:MAG: winged helix-turn-helix domain-containing protein [bacterium]|nr:winged helix-turn-helix domain-containing protein [bacterium]